ncbi:MAG: hypothetical protein KC561_10885 [Myxococcales bacterium]|nr:hypothetical protein [Myxococcales bacterium]
MHELLTTDIIEYDVEDVFRAQRDHLAELVEFLPNVSDIEVRSREEVDGKVKLVNVWTAARTEIPAVIRPFVKPEMMSWIDYASWDERTLVCNWEIELGFLKEAVKCAGVNRMERTAEGHTAVIIEGKLSVDATKIPGVPKFMAKKVSSAVEAFVAKNITPNLKKTNDGVRKYLASRKS